MVFYAFAHILDIQFSGSSFCLIIAKQSES